MSSFKQKFVLFWILAALSLSGANVFAAKVLTPETITNIPTVDTGWVKANMKGAVIIDTRKKAEYVEGHVPGALLLTYRGQRKVKVPDFDASKDRFNTKKIPGDKNTSLIIYCQGPYCWKSYKAAVVLHRAGYKNVYWYRNGYPGWKKAGLPIDR